MTAARSISPSKILQLVAVDDILGVVEHDRFGGAARLQLMDDQRIVEMVEAVGLGGRPVGGHLDGVDAGVGDAGDCRRGRRIVAIMADEDPVIVIIDALERRLEHRGDDRRLVPGRHQDRDETGRLLEDRNSSRRRGRCRR